MESICSSANEFYVVDALLVFFFLFLSMPRIPLRFPSVFPFLEDARLPFLFLDYFERLVDEVARSLRSHVIALSLSLSLALFPVYISLVSWIASLAAFFIRFASSFCARAFGFTALLLNSRLFTYYLRSLELVLGYLERITGFIDTTKVHFLAHFISLLAFE